jgi:hypothetical protein
MFTIISPAKELENAQEQWLLHVLAARPHHAFLLLPSVDGSWPYHPYGNCSGDWGIGECI